MNDAPDSTQEAAQVGWPGEEFLCACNSESLRVGFNEDGEMELSFWSFGFHNGRLRWRDRPPWLWRVLVHGTPYGDQIILDKEATIALSMLLNRAHGVWTVTGQSTVGTGYQLRMGQVPPYGTYTADAG